MYSWNGGPQSRKPWNSSRAEHRRNGMYSRCGCEVADAGPGDLSTTIGPATESCGSFGSGQRVGTLSPIGPVRAGVGFSAKASSELHGESLWKLPGEAMLLLRLRMIVPAKGSVCAL